MEESNPSLQSLKPMDDRTSSTLLRTHYVLVDFENVQPESVEELAAAHFRLVVFVGSNQPKIPVRLAAAIQAMGDRANYVQISGNGRNALDFHIAYYIGSLALQDPRAFFHIISRDTGFDPLVQHLKTLGFDAARSSTLGEIPLARGNGLRSHEAQAGLFIERLQKSGLEAR